MSIFFYKFRMYPNEEQIILINKIFGCYRFIYNYFLNKCKSDIYDIFLELKEMYSECEWRPSEFKTMENKGYFI